MKIKVSKLREAMELVNPIVPSKATFKSIQYVLLKEGKLVGTDLDTMVIIDMPEVDITSLLSIKQVLKVLTFVPGYDIVEIKPNEKSVSLSWTDGNAKFPTEDVKDFPEVPEFEHVTDNRLNSDLLIPVLEEMRSYAAKEDDRAVLKGVTLMLANPIHIAAGDGFRMADREIDLSYPEDLTVIIPLDSVKNLYHLWKKGSRTPPNSNELVPVLTSKKMVNLSHNGKGGLMFQFDNGITAIIRLVEGNPPDWLKLLPKGKPVLKVQLMAPDLQVALNRVKSTALDGSGKVIIDFVDNRATISAKSNDDMETESSINTINAEGVPNKLAINVNYILGYLKDKEGIVSISWTGSGSPIAFQSLNTPRVLIMPMVPN